MDSFNLFIFSRSYEFKEKWMNLTRLIAIVLGSFFISIMSYFSFDLGEGWFTIIMWFASGVVWTLNTIDYYKK